MDNNDNLSAFFFLFYSITVRIKWDNLSIYYGYKSQLHTYKQARNITIFYIVIIFNTLYVLNQLNVIFKPPSDQQENHFSHFGGCPTPAEYSGPRDLWRTKLIKTTSLVILHIVDPWGTHSSYPNLHMVLGCWRAEDWTINKSQLDCFNLIPQIQKSPPYQVLYLCAFGSCSPECLPFSALCPGLLKSQNIL